MEFKNGLVKKLSFYRKKHLADHWVFFSFIWE